MLRRRARSFVRLVVGAFLLAAGTYWNYRLMVEPDSPVAFDGSLLVVPGLWLTGTWVYARWRLRHARTTLVDLSQDVMDLVGSDTLPMYPVRRGGC
jgi:hypothetical protein